MTITAIQKDGRNLEPLSSGSYFDDAASPAAASITLGYVPRYFRWVNVTDRIEWEWFDGAANGTTLKTVAAGTRTLDTADVAISVSSVNQSSGTVTIAAAAILQNKQYRWQASA
jgi:hypothetical protein